MRHSWRFLTDNFEIRVDIFLLEGIIVVLDIASDCNSVRSEQFAQVVFCRTRQWINESFFPVLVIPYELADWNAELFDKGQVCNEAFELQSWRIVDAEGFVWFLKGGTSR